MVVTGFFVLCTILNDALIVLPSILHELITKNKVIFVVRFIVASVCGLMKQMNNHSYYINCKDFLLDRIIGYDIYKMCSVFFMQLQNL